MSHDDKSSNSNTLQKLKQSQKTESLLCIMLMRKQGIFQKKRFEFEKTNIYPSYDFVVADFVTQHTILQNYAIVYWESLLIQEDDSRKNTV